MVGRGPVGDPFAMAQLDQQAVGVHEFISIKAVVGINLQVQVRRILLDSGVAYIGD